MSVTISFKIISPNKYIPDPKDVLREIERTMKSKTAGDLKRDFRATVRSWKDKPKFPHRFFKNPNQYVLKVFPDGQFADRYAWIDLGTKPRVIVPRNPGGRLKFQGGPYVSQTRPGVIGSAKGGPTGPYVYPTIARRYPGIKAREFSEMIAAHNEMTFQRDIQDAINRAVRGR